MTCTLKNHHPCTKGVMMYCPSSICSNRCSVRRLPTRAAAITGASWRRHTPPSGRAFSSIPRTIATFMRWAPCKAAAFCNQASLGSHTIALSRMQCNTAMELHQNLPCHQQREQPNQKSDLTIIGTYGITHNDKVWSCHASKS